MILLLLRQTSSIRLSVSRIGMTLLIRKLKKKVFPYLVFMLEINQD